MKRWVYSIVAMIALITAGLVHGYWTDRWVADQGVAEAAARLAKIPMKIGEWEGTDLEVKRGQIGPGVAGYVQRTYKNRRLGTEVVIALVNGRPGPVATHTPEACYGGAGYEVGKREMVPLDTADGSAQFWVADAERIRVAKQTKIRLYWAWNGGDGWKASGEAREQFPRFRYPVLHKLYVIRDLTDPDSAVTKRDAKEEPCRVFLEALVPVLEQKLFAQGG